MAAVETTATGPVLLCYDGSDHANRAIRHAAALLRPRHAVVIHVPLRGFKGDVAESGRRVALDGGFDSVAVVESKHGRIATVILEEARNRGASVIVLGSHGRSPSQPVLLGSVSSTLVRESDIPVLVGRAGVAPSHASEPIFICYDGPSIAREALLTAAGLLAGRAAMVAAFIPAVDDAPLLRSTLPWPVGGETEDQLARMDRQEAEGPEKRAADGAQIAAAAGFAPRSLAIPGMDATTEEEERPWRRLLRAAASEDAACIVVGHRPSVTHLESTAYGLVHHADRPVLVVPGESSS
jgi:nucleotide-binding universal stress UspA family protein